MTIASLTQQEARRLIEEGATLVDIREPDEFRREHIPGARNVPLAFRDAGSEAETVRDAQEPAARAAIRTPGGAGPARGAGAGFAGSPRPPQARAYAGARHWSEAAA